jgi:hypothetical protein
LGLIFVPLIFLIDLFITLFCCEYDLYFTDQIQKFYQKRGFL